MWHGGQIEGLPLRLWPILSDLVEVVATVAKIKEIPGAMVAPVLRVVVLKGCKWVV